jgi:tetratricopeptide (TPR) repeat protein
LFWQVGQMADQGMAVHRTIVVVDVEGFGDQRRTNAHQVAVRAGLYRVMREAFGRTGISWDDCGVEDRGDGVFVLVPAEVPKGLLAESLPPALVTGLGTHNRAHPGPERIRLRMALHAGEVHYDEHGVTGGSVNLAFRLVDAGSLKAALAGSPGVLAVIASSWFFDEVIRHISSGADAAYRRVEVAVKETTATGWVCLPDQVDRTGRATPELPSPAAGSPGMQPTVALRTLPRDAVAFTGRARELDRLVTAVSSAAAGGVFGIHAVDGMAGIGKTAFAVYAAHQLAARFPDGQIFLRLYAHTAGHRPVDPVEALATLLLTIGVAPQQIPPGLEARSGLWRDHLAGKKMLLVLDDAADSEQVRPLLPGAADCLVLVTSRRRLAALEEAAPISLGTLPPGEAADLFVRLAIRPSLQPGHHAVAEVTRLCGYLPLAIRLMAAGIRHHPAWTVTDLAAELAAARDRLAAMQAEDVSVTAAFDLSYKDLTGRQRRLFRRLGLHPGTEIDAYAAAAMDGTDLPTARRCLSELHDQNLIGEPARGRYRLHDLLREHARTLAAGDDAADRQASVDRLLDYYMHTAVTASRHAAWRTSIGGPPQPGLAPAWTPELRTEEEAITWLRTERANLHACIDYATTHARLTHAVCVLFAISDSLHNQGHWNEAVTFGQAVLAAACTIGDRQGQAWALAELGTMQERTADYQAAAASLARALQLFGDLGDQRGQAWALNQLGIVQLLTGAYPAATAGLARALQLYRELGDRRGQAWALNKLSVVQRRTGDYPAATASLTQTLQLLGDLGDRRGQAWALDDLGAVRQLTGDLEAASASLRQALQLSSELGDRHCQAVVLRHLGMVQRRTGDYPAATASLARALQLYQDLGDRHGQAGASINLGDLLSASSDHNDALGYFAQALNTARDIGAPVLQARALEGIGRCHVRDGNAGRGTAHLQQALAIYQSIGAPEAKSVETALLEQARMTTKGGATSG